MSSALGLLNARLVPWAVLSRIWDVAGCPMRAGTVLLQKKTFNDFYFIFYSTAIFFKYLKIFFELVLLQLPTM
jgi:hypothetical protein